MAKIIFYGYAVKKNGKYLGYNPTRDESGKMYKKQLYKSPMFPVVAALEETQRNYNGYLGEVVKMRFTMEEDLPPCASPCGDGIGGETKKEIQNMKKKPTAKKPTAAKVAAKPAKKPATAKKPAKVAAKPAPAKKSAKK